MSPTQAPLLRARVARAFSSALFLCLIAAAKAAISVGPGGSGVITFTTAADISAWTTASRLPNSGTAVATGTDLDNAVQTNTSPNIAVTATTSPVNAAVPTDNTGAQQNSSRWNSTSGWLYTRPTGNAYQLLMAQLQNDSGGCINAITITLDMTSYSAATAELPGWHVYYSLTGAANSWQLIPGLSDTVINGTLSTNVTLSGNWDAGTALYLLWADDNGNGVTDPGYTIDNLSIVPTPCNLTCVGITNQSGSITVPERGAATFSIMATGSPQTIQWHRQNSGGGGFTAIPGATASSYTIASAVYPDDNGAQFRASVSNGQCNVTSSAATLTVLPDTNSPSVIQAVGQVALDTIIITFTEPIDPGVLDPGSFFLYESTFVGDPSSTPYNTYSVTLSNQTNVILQTDPRDLSKNYLVEVAYVQDASFNHNVLSPLPTEAPLRQTLPLIGFDVNNEWKFSTETNLFGTGWETVGYDDSSWSSGPSGLGVDASAGTGTGPGLPQPVIRTATAYAAHSEPQFFRRHFNFPASTNGAILSMRHVFEDGAVVFINGEEAGRFNVGAGVLSVTTRAAANQTDPTPISGPVSLPLTNVYPGDNVIAVVVIQSGATSSDIELAVELNAEVQTILSGPPVIVGQPQNRSVSEGQSVTFTVVAEGQVPLSYQWFKGVNAISGANASSYTIFSPVPGDAGTYHVQVSNSLGTTNSTNVTLSVGVDSTPPHIVSAVADTNFTTVVVTLSDTGTGINYTTASNAANYQVHLTAGGGNIGVTSAAAAPSGSNAVVTLTLAGPLVQGQAYTLVINGVTDRASTPNALTPNTAAIAETIVFFPFTSIWRYDQSGSDLGTAWRNVGYDDSAWLSGAGVLGFETSANTLIFLTNISPPNATNTVLSLTNGTGGGIGGTNVTIYFRTTINMTDFDPAAATVTMRAYIDDGAILYINGVERFRYNMTNAAGYTNFANAALTEPNPAPQTTFVISNLAGLVCGPNVVAVEVHQDAIASSDIDWGMQLEAQVTTFGGCGTGPRLNVSLNTTTSQVTISWAGGGTLQQAGALQSGGATAWADVPGNPTSPYTFTPGAGNNFYRLR